MGAATMPIILLFFKSCLQALAVELRLDADAKGRAGMGIFQHVLRGRHLHLSTEGCGRIEFWKGGGGLVGSGRWWWRAHVDFRAAAH